MYIEIVLYNQWFWFMFEDNNIIILNYCIKSCIRRNILVECHNIKMWKVGMEW